MITLRHIAATLLTVLAFNAFAAVEANRANQAELETVKGIGPALSTKILQARQSGDFRDWTDLVERVSGVGPGSAVRLSGQGLTVGGQAYTAPAHTDKPARASRAEGSVKPVAEKAGAKAARGN